VRGERLVAIGRVVLASVSLVVVWLDPTVPIRAVPVAYGLLGIYAVYAGIVALVVLRWGPGQRWQRLATHAIDLLVFVGVYYLPEAITRPIFLYFVFALLSAGLRFRTRGTIWTAVIAISAFGMVGIHEVLLHPGSETEPNRFVVRIVYLVVLSVILIYLNHHQERHRRELSLLASWPRAFPAARDELLEEVIRSAREIMSAPRVYIILEDMLSRGRELLWSEDGSLRKEKSLFAGLADEDYFCRYPSPEPSRAVRLAPEGFLSVDAPPEAATIRDQLGASNVLSIKIRGRSVTGTLLALDLADVTEDDLVLGRLVAGLIATRLDELYYLESVALAAVSDERVRVSRELHDGVLQSLTAIALKLRVAEGTIPREPGRAIDILSELRHAITEDQRELREFVSALRRDYGEVSGEGGSLEERLGSVVSRIRVVWALEVELRIGSLPGDLKPSVRTEVVRFVQEALANAGKHGNATRAVVELEDAGGSIIVRVRDNGRGLADKGTFDLRALDVEDLGPKSLRERIAALGGELTLVSDDDGVLIEGAIPIGLGRAGDGQVATV